MSAVVTVTSSPESATNLKVIKSDIFDSEIILQPGMAEQIILGDGVSLSIDNVVEESGEEENREAAVEAGEKTDDEA